MTPIVAATDLTEKSDNAIAVAHRHAASSDAPLHIVHVARPPEEPAYPYVYAADAGPIDAMRARAQRELDGYVKGLELEGGQVETAVRLGRPHVEIAELARELDAHLIVLGARERPHDLQARIFGRTASRVVRLAPCPVLSIRREHPDGIQSMLVGIDLTDEAAAVLRTTREFAERTGASLEVAFAVEPIPLPSELLHRESWVPMEERIRARFAQLWEAAGGDASALPELHIRDGDPVEQVLETAAERDCDMVAVGARGAGRIAGLLLGSVAEGILRASTASVFVARRPEE